jgi:putative peptide zinc metalloprotease protein
MSPERLSLSETMIIPEICEDSRIVLSRYKVYRFDDEPPLVKNLQTDQFLEVDEHTLLAMRFLETTESVAETRSRLREAVGEDFAVTNLVETLRRSGFILSIDGKNIPFREKPERTRHNLLRLIDPHYLGWMHGRAVFTVASLIILAWLAAIIRYPEYRPTYQDLTVFPDPASSLTAVLAGLLVATYLHEIGHYLMARSFNVDATIGFSHKLLVLVLKTDVTDAWRIPSKKRLWIFSAGILVNILLASVSGLVAIFVSMYAGASQLMLLNILRFFVIINLLPLVYQLFIGGRTDVYFFIATLLHERNLTDDSTAYVKRRIRNIAETWKNRILLHRLVRRQETPESSGMESTRGVAQAIAGPIQPAFRRRTRFVYWWFGSLTILGRFAGRVFFFGIVLPLVLRLIWHRSQSMGADIRSSDFVMAFFDMVILGVLIVQLWASIHYLVRTSYTWWMQTKDMRLSPS